MAHLHRNLHRINPVPHSKLRILLCNRVHQTMTIVFSQAVLPRFEPAGPAASAGVKGIGPAQDLFFSRGGQAFVVPQAALGQRPVAYW
jgi:hypothetical protein